MVAMLYSGGEKEREFGEGGREGGRETIVRRLAARLIPN